MISDWWLTSELVFRTVVVGLFLQCQDDTPDSFRNVHRVCRLLRASRECRRGDGCSQDQDEGARRELSARIFVELLG